MDDPKWYERRRKHDLKHAAAKKQLVVDRQRRYRNSHKHLPQRSMFLGAKWRANKRGMDFKLTIEDVVIPDVCPVLGIPLFISKGRQTDNSPSIDRKNTTVGYTKENICVISWRANRLKGDASPEELKALSKYYEKVPYV